MSINWQWVNGMCFGITHQYFLDLDAGLEEGSVDLLPRVPMVTVYIGPFLILISW